MIPLIVLVVCAGAAAAQDLSVASPDGRVRFELTAGRLQYRVTLAGKPAIEPSALGMTVDGVNLADGASAGAAERYRVDESYPWYGARATAVDRCNGARFAVIHKASGTKYTLEVRAYDDGVAFRHIVPGQDKRVPDEATAFVLPAGSTVWIHDAEDHYEAQHVRKSLRAVAPSEWALPPLTARLPENLGYVSITEGRRGSRRAQAGAPDAAALGCAVRADALGRRLRGPVHALTAATATTFGSPRPGLSR